MATQTPPTFRQLFYAARARRGDSQLTAANWLNDRMSRDGIDLSKPYMSTSQAAISKWEDGAIPDPVKWPYLATYCAVSEGVIARLLGDPSQSNSVGVLREALVDAQAETRLLRLRVEELVEVQAETDDKLVRVQRLRDKDRAKLRQLEAALNAAQRELAEVRAATPARRPRAATAAAS